MTNDKFKMHKFALACVLDEIEVGATDLVFYLRHDKGADDKTDVYYSNWYGYDIKNALERFKEKAGNLPTKLVIKSQKVEIIAIQKYRKTIRNIL